MMYLTYNKLSARCRKIKRYYDFNEGSKEEAGLYEAI